jgi:hypothetical protein
VLDYEVLNATSYPVDWFKDQDKKDKKSGKDETIYQSFVSVHRKGDFVLPIEIEIKFEDGEKIRERWDGQSRWARFGYHKKSKVASVEIDPNHTIQLDRDNFKTSRLVEPNPKPTKKISNYWLFVTQCISQAMAWWAV